MAVKGEVMGWGLAWLAVGTVVGWLATNFFGLYQNGRMRTQLERILRAGGEHLEHEKWFVGFATPRYSSTLDPHEDVGFLLLEDDRLRFVSETRAVEVLRTDVRHVRFRPNVHSLLLLGRWVSVEGKVGEKPIRLMVEPREKRTLLGNRRAGAQLRVHLAKWVNPKLKGNTLDSRPREKKGLRLKG
jgi:hypothetical protein